MFITAFTSARHLSLSWSRSIHSMPLSHFLKIHHNILPLHLRLPSGFFPSGFPTKTLYAPLLPPCVLHAPPISFFSTALSTDPQSRIQVFQYMTPCWLVNSYPRLGGAWCLHLQWRTVRTLNFEASSVSVEYLVVLLKNTAGCAKLNSVTNDWGDVMKLVTLFHRVWCLWEVTR
jgi:hypothetical protein